MPVCQLIECDVLARSSTKFQCF